MACFGCQKIPADDASTVTEDSENQEGRNEDSMLLDGGLSRKAIVDSLKRQKSKGSTFEEELNILSKIYSNEDCSDELLALGKRDRGALRNLIPMILNAILYGYKEVRPGTSEHSGSRRRSNSSRSSDGNGFQLDTTKLLEKDAEVEALELALMQECAESVDFALGCAFYLQSCLQLSPESEHKTVSLLLQVEAAVMAGVQSSNEQQNVDDTDAGELRGPVELGTLASLNNAQLISWLEIQKQSGDFYHAQRDFVTCLTDISRDLFNIEKTQRLPALRRELEKLNDFLPRNVYVPVDNKAHRVLRVVPEESFVFSTKERAPYFLTLEVEDFGAQTNRNNGARHTQDLSNRREEAFAFKAEFEEIGDASKQPEEPAVGEPNPETQETETKEEENEENSENPVAVSSSKTGAGFGELWDAKSERLRKESQYGDKPNWRLTAVIVKARDQLRQEMFAQTLVAEFAYLFERSRKLNLWVKPYRILATSSTSGFIECIFNSKSVHSIKSSMPGNLGVNTLAEFFKMTFGEPNSTTYKKAMNNFITSLAGYSVVSYILQIKDRHNGNIMVDAAGHIIHIDFGFLLSNSPGGNFEFEKAPFKLSNELLAVLGGPDSPNLKKFIKISRIGYAETCRSSFANKILLMVDMMYQGNEDMPCFTRGREYVLKSLKERFSPNMSSKERRRKWDSLVAESARNWTTKGYDMYQKCFTGIN